MRSTSKYVKLTAILCSSAILLTSCGLIEWNIGNETAATETAPNDTDSITVTDIQPVDTTENTDTAPENTPIDPLAHVKNADLSASAVIIATVDGTTVCPMTPDGDPVITARSSVKHAVEEKFGTTIITTVTDSRSMLEDAREAYNSDMYYADLIAPASKDVGKFYAEGLLANLYSLPHVNFTAEYFDSGMLAAAVAGDGIYAVSGAANFNPDYLNCIFYNRTIADSLGLGDLGALVKDGKWTVDKYRELAITASASLGISGHGSVHELNGYIDVLALSQGIDFVSNSEGTVPVVDYLEDSKAAKSKAIVDNISSLIYADNTFTKSFGDNCRSQFTSGTLLFMTDSMYVAEWISDSSTDWGLLPLPKYSEEQKNYRSLISPDSPVFCALVNTPGYETSGLILESLNASAEDCIIDAYKNKLIDYFLRDSSSIAMLDVICDSAVNDFVHMYASGVSSLESATVDAVRRAVTTSRSIDPYYRNHKNAANRAISLSIDVIG